MERSSHLEKCDSSSWRWNDDIEDKGGSGGFVLPGSSRRRASCADGANTDLNRMNVDATYMLKKKHKRSSICFLGLLVLFVAHQQSDISMVIILGPLSRSAGSSGQHLLKVGSPSYGKRSEKVRIVSEQFYQERLTCIYIYVYIYIVYL